MISHALPTESASLKKWLLELLVTLEASSGVKTTEEQEEGLYEALLAQKYTVGEAARQWILRGIEWHYRKERMVTLADFYPTREQVDKIANSNFLVIKKEDYIKAIAAAREEGRASAEVASKEDDVARAYARDYLEKSTYSHRLRTICRVNGISIPPAHSIELDYITMTMTEEGIPIPPPESYADIIDKHRFRHPQAPPPKGNTERRALITQLTEAIIGAA
jgi:hypothetical protein